MNRQDARNRSMQSNASSSSSSSSHVSVQSRASTPRPNPNAPLDCFYPLYMKYMRTYISAVDVNLPQNANLPIDEWRRRLDALEGRWVDLVDACQEAFETNLTCRTCFDRPETIIANGSPRHAYSRELQQKVTDLVNDMEGASLTRLNQHKLDNIRRRWYSLELQYQQENLSTQCPGLIEIDNRDETNYGEDGPPEGFGEGE